MVATIFALLEFGVRWRATWTAEASNRAMVFSYRKPREASFPDGSLACDMDSAGE